MTYTDAHCHLTRVRDSEEFARALADANREGISRFVLGGVDSKDWHQQVALKRAGLFAVFGIHPWTVAQVNERELLDGELCLLRQLSSECVAIGEIGLDLSKKNDPNSLSLQLSYFEKQLELAEEMEKPVVLHIVKAHQQALQLLRSARSARGMVHAFGGSPELAHDYIRLGLYLSLGPGVSRLSNGKLQKLVAAIPMDKLLIETDFPDQASSLLELKTVGDRLAAAYGVSAETIMNITSQNSSVLFGLGERI